MKKTILALAILMSSCGTPKINFKEANLDYTVTENIDVKLCYPIASCENSAVADSINAAILGCLTSEEAPTLESIITVAKESEHDSIPYGNCSEWSGFQNADYISLYVENYLFMGGAHGNTTVNAMTFDNKNGARVNIKAHIKDTIAFRQLFVDSYIAEYKFDINTSAAEIGYFVDLKDLPIPTQMMLTDKGVVGYYQQYEIACYAVGITSATVPYDKLTAILDMNTEEIKPIETIK